MRIRIGGQISSSLLNEIPMHHSSILFLYPSYKFFAKKTLFPGKKTGNNIFRTFKKPHWLKIWALEFKID